MIARPRTVLLPTCKYEYEVGGSGSGKLKLKDLLKSKKVIVWFKV